MSSHAGTVFRTALAASEPNAARAPPQASAFPSAETGIAIPQRATPPVRKTAEVREVATMMGCVIRQKTPRRAHRTAQRRHAISLTCPRISRSAAAMGSATRVRIQTSVQETARPVAAMVSARPVKARTPIAAARIVASQVPPAQTAAPRFRPSRCRTSRPAHLSW